MVSPTAAESSPGSKPVRVRSWKVGMCFAKRRHPQCPAVLIQELLLATAASGEGIQTWRAVLQLQELAARRILRMHQRHLTCMVTVADLDWCGAEGAAQCAD
jgi:hypothetical protein